MASAWSEQQWRALLEQVRDMYAGNDGRALRDASKLWEQSKDDKQLYNEQMALLRSKKPEMEKEGGQEEAASKACKKSKRTAAEAQSTDTLSVFDLFEAMHCQPPSKRVALPSGGSTSCTRLTSELLSQLVLKQSWKGHSDWVRSVAMSADGRIAVSGGSDKSIRVWDVEKGECLNVMEEAHSSGVNCLLLACNQSIVISGSDGDTSIKSFSFDGRRLKLIWEKEVKRMSCLCLSDDETMIAAGSDEDKHCFVLNRVDGTLLVKIATGSRALYAVRFARSWLLCGGSERTVDVIDVSKKSLVGQLTGPTDWVVCIAYCPSLDLIAAGTAYRDTSIHIWHLSTGESVTRLTGHTSDVLSLLFHPINPNILLSCSGDGSIRVWRVSDSVCLCCVYKGHVRSILHLSISSNGKMLLSAGSDISIKKWSIE